MLALAPSVSNVLATAVVPPIHDTAPGGVEVGQTLSQSSPSAPVGTDVWAFRSSWNTPTSWTACALDTDKTANTAPASTAALNVRFLNIRASSFPQMKASALCGRASGYPWGSPVSATSFFCWGSGTRQSRKSGGRMRETAAPPPNISRPTRQPDQPNTNSLAPEPGTAFRRRPTRRVPALPLASGHVD